MFIYDAFIKSEKIILKLSLGYTTYKLSYLILFSFIENIQYKNIYINIRTYFIVSLIYIMRQKFA